MRLRVGSVVLVVIAGCASAPPVAKTAPQPLTKTEVDRFLSTWLAAQHASDVRGVDALYAANATAVTRTADKRHTHRRAAWMKRRSALFRTFLIAALDIEIAVLTDTKATAEFTERRQSGMLADEVRKLLTIERHAGRLRVVREEMTDVPVAATLATWAQQTTEHTALSDLPPKVPRELREIAVRADNAAPQWVMALSSSLVIFGANTRTVGRSMTSTRNR